MIRFIFAWLGYVKVPKEAVVCALTIENACNMINRKLPDSNSAKALCGMASAIREFLQTGRFVQ